MKLCHAREELARLPQGPKVVLATLPSLQAGMARDLFVEWAADPRNLILFTQQAEVCKVITSRNHPHTYSFTQSSLTGFFMEWLADPRAASSSPSMFRYAMS